MHPPIIYGTAWKKEQTKDLVIQAVKTGFRAIDTACQPKHYHEKGVGDALKVLQAEGFDTKELFVQTKFTPLAGQDPLNIPYDKNTPLEKQVQDSFEASKANLGLDYIDALLLHSPLFPYKDLLSVYRQMEAIHARGEVGAIGISNTYDLATLKRLYEDATIKPTYLQNRFYADSDYDVKIRSWCREHNLIYQSFWTLTANPHILQSETLFKLSRKYKAELVQIYFAYLHHIGIIPLTGTKDEEHMQSDLKSFDFELSHEEIHELDGLFN